MRAAFVALAIGAAAGLAGCVAQPVDAPCPDVPGMTAIDLRIEEFGLEGALPAGHCDYEDTTGTYSEDERFAIAVWRTPPSGVMAEVVALATASGFVPASASDPEFPDGELEAWQAAGFRGAVIAFAELPESQAPAGYEAFAGAPLAWVGLHAPE